MNHAKSNIRRIGLFACLVLVLTAWVLAPAPEARAQGEPYMELLRKDIQADKVTLLTMALEMTEEQGEKFWPIYRDYQVELAKLGDRRIQMIKSFAANYDNMTAEKAQGLAKESFDIQEKSLKLLKKTHKKVSKEIDPILATRFAQVENQLNMLINLQIASELPLIK
jgi:hypothetical protein